jgi:Ca-activated chloride channel family protein
MCREKMKRKAALVVSIAYATMLAASLIAGTGAPAHTFQQQDAKQNPSRQGVQQDAKKPDASTEISVIAITIAVTVQTQGGRYVNDLAEKDFAVFENSRRRPLTYFRHDFNAPVSLTILLDVSGSMAVEDKLAEIKSCLRPFLLSSLKPKDEVALLIFADGAVEVACGHTTDKQDLWSVLEKTEAYGKTALNDAVGVSPDFANKGSCEKRALILLTDGVENDSEYSAEQALEVARRVDVPIYTIGYKIPLTEDELRLLKKSPGSTSAGIAANLEKFSRATGGKAFFLRTPEELTATLSEIKSELGHYYIIGYTSYKNVTEEYRQIRVTTPKHNYRVRTRMGY